ncbi:hypothetical protein H4R33_000993 [Dimargaris cristalligena]|nr:hypothetical protein H4R33_000993 [Dimargaris cristalligena]
MSATASDPNVVDRFLTFLREAQYPQTSSLTRPDLAWAFQTEGIRDLLVWLTDHIDPFEQVLRPGELEWLIKSHASLVLDTTDQVADSHFQIPSTTNSTAAAVASLVTTGDHLVVERDLDETLAFHSAENSDLEAYLADLDQQHHHLSQTLASLQAQVGQVKEDTHRLERRDQKLERDLNTLAMEHDRALRQEGEAIGDYLQGLLRRPTDSDDDSTALYLFQATDALSRLLNANTGGLQAFQQRLTLNIEGANRITPAIRRKFPLVPPTVPDLTNLLHTENERLSRALTDEAFDYLQHQYQITHLEARLAQLEDTHRTVIDLAQTNPELVSGKLTEARHHIDDTTSARSVIWDHAVPAALLASLQSPLSRTLDHRLARITVAHQNHLLGQLNEMAALARSQVADMEAVDLLIRASGQAVVESLNKASQFQEDQISASQLAALRLAHLQLPTTIQRNEQKSTLDSDDHFYGTLLDLLTLYHSIDSDEGPQESAAFASYDHLVRLGQHVVDKDLKPATKQQRIASDRWMQFVRFM